MQVSVVLGHSEVAFVDSVDFAVVDHGADSGVVCVEDSRAKAPVVISLKTYMRTTPALTNRRPVDYEWMAIPAHPLGLPLSLAAVGTEAASMQSPANR